MFRTGLTDRTWCGPDLLCRPDRTTGYRTDRGVTDQTGTWNGQWPYSDDGPVKFLSDYESDPSVKFFLTDTVRIMKGGISADGLRKGSRHRLSKCPPKTLPARNSVHVIPYVLNLDMSLILFPPPPGPASRTFIPSRGKKIIKLLTAHVQ